MGAYKDALDMFSQVSLRRSGESGEYAKVVYQTLPVMMAELLAEERRCLRFTRFRARALNLQEMARTVAYGAEQKQLRKTKLRGKAKLQLKQALYEKKRVVFLGTRSLDTVRAGRALGQANFYCALTLLCPVFLVDEYCTSKCWKGCGSV